MAEFVCLPQPTQQLLIRLPPLRERREDIPALVAFLATEAAAAMHKETPSVSDQAMSLLLHHPFWGNIRELKTYIVDAVARCETGKIEEDLISGRLVAQVSAGHETTSGASSLTSLFGRFPSLEELVEYATSEALASSDNNQSQAARLLGISRQALHKRLRKRG